MREVIFSLLRTVKLLLTGGLSFSREYTDREFLAEDGTKFTIFRHMRVREATFDPALLIVRFKFARLSHGANKRASRIPIPLIAGFPGFRHKLWMIDEKSDYWQGLYEWRDREALERYRESFVLSLMNKRAQAGTVSYEVIHSYSIEEYLKAHIAK